RRRSARDVDGGEMQRSGAKTIRQVYSQPCSAYRQVNNLTQRGIGKIFWAQRIPGLNQLLRSRPGSDPTVHFAVLREDSCAGEHENGDCCRQPETHKLAVCLTRSETKRRPRSIALACVRFHSPNHRGITSRSI